ncbi:MAG: type II/IV secretion system protein [Candidatus Hydrogenedentes bacterium]|nr:type II/IV secretion system protein [Candidatus Hydrogenedentota bacterium]
MDTLSNETLQEALDQFRRTGDSLGKCLASRGWTNERAALAALAEALGIQFVDLSAAEIDRTAATGIPSELIHKARVIPVSQTDGRLLLAMENPFDFQTVDHIRILTGKEVDRAIATESDMAAAMQTFFGFSVERMIEHLEIADQGHAADTVQIGHLREIASEPTVVNLVNLMIARAIRDRASDVHIEPFDKVLKVKYRIDGVLHDMPSPPKHLQDAIISRVKIMAEMNIAERYIPQDGHIELNFEGHEVDVRVATVPTIFGESVVMRLLDKTSFLYGIENLGFEEETLRRYRRLLRNPHGIVLVCGPTGSGKTTTLYASLTDIYTTERKFITIEDPVEYELEGVNQIPVRPKRGLTFANGLRAIVRQDPDVIMVGEIRDSETAEIAIRSALTGHLVLSSLHTNDAPESIARLLDMGVQPYLIASAVRGILGQRLVRKVCAACRQPEEPSEAQLIQIRRELGSDVKPVLYRGRGCSECNGTGYRGRTAILEVMTIDDGLRDLILQRASASAIRRYLGAGMQTMREAGWRNVAAGLTTPEEVLRATQMEEESGFEDATE